MDAFLIAICLLMIIEGLGPLLLPNKWRVLLREISEQPSQTLRRIGAVLIVAGVLGLYFITV
ncbi:DUF2065 domain-containing protein [Glaciecola sp. SC05]|uniref:DUF2065 domain-containing protein n=1 Tax=Glaciecola sp. SC05 TaxID=1987355 RepID=UPI003529BA63